MGDSAMNENEPLPQLAQVARQQGMYLADVFDDLGIREWTHSHRGSTASASPGTDVSIVRKQKNRAIVLAAKNQGGFQIIHPADLFKRAMGKLGGQLGYSLFQPGRQIGI